MTDSKARKRVKDYPCEATVDGAPCVNPAEITDYCAPHYRQVKAGKVPSKIKAQRPPGAALIRNEYGEKYCGVCKTWKDPETFFHKAKETRDGYQSTCIRCVRNRRLIGTYGVTIKEYESMLAAQDHRCAICQRDEPGGHGTWHLDHDHVTGEPRGVLCWRCNSAIGLFGDDPTMLIAAVAYLEEKQNVD